MKPLQRIMLSIEILLLLVIGSLGPSVYSAPAATNTKTISMDFRDADIDQVLKLFSLASGLTVIKDPAVTGTVTIINPNKLSIDEALGILESMLAVRGFTIKRDEHLIAVVPVPKASAPEVQLGLKVDNAANKIITQVIQLEYADAAELKTELLPVLSERANLMVSVQTNTLIVTDFAENVKRLADVVAGIEKLGAPPRAETQGAREPNVSGEAQDAQRNARSANRQDSQITKVIYVKYANATDLARELSQVFSSQQQSSGAASGGARDIPIEQRLLGVAQALTNNAAPSAANQQQTQQSRGNARENQGGRNSRSSTSQISVKIVANVYSNSLVVIGSPESVSEVEAIVRSLDQEGAASVTYIYHVKNGSASDLASSISAIYTVTNSSGQKQNRTVTQPNNNKNTTQANRQNAQRNQNQNQNQNQARQTAQQRQSGQNNAPVVSTVTSVGTSGRPRVASDLRIVPNDVSNTILIFGPIETIEEIKQLLAQIDQPTPQVLIEAMIVEASLENGNKLGISWDSLGAGSNTSGSMVDWGANPVQGLKYQIIADSVKAVMETIKTDSQFKVLSTPKIMTVNNSSARMYVGQSVPYVRSTNVTSDGRTVNTYAFQNVGVTLQVFPRITESGYIGLDVNQTSSEVMASTAPGAPPIFSTREAQTSVMVKHGETVVIGGIIRENKTDQVKKIPLLGDIPFLGALFRRTETITTKSELLVFITPYIIRSDTDAMMVTEHEQQNTSKSFRDSIVMPKPVPLGNNENDIKQ